MNRPLPMLEPVPVLKGKDYQEVLRRELVDLRDMHKTDGKKSQVLIGVFEKIFYPFHRLGMEK